MKKYRVVSNSMEPVILTGAELELEDVVLEDLKKFDIIVFREDEKYTCHYIWHINKNLDKGLITTRNLDGYHFDDPFYFERVLGRVKNYKLPFLTKVKLLFWVR